MEEVVGSIPTRSTKSLLSVSVKSWRSPLHFKPPLVRDYFAVLQMAPQKPQVHCPAKTGKAPMFIVGRPARMVEPHTRHVLVFRLQLATHTGIHPIRVGRGHLQFKL